MAVADASGALIAPSAAEMPRAAPSAEAPAAGASAPVPDFEPRVAETFVPEPVAAPSAPAQRVAAEPAPAERFAADPVAAEAAAPPQVSTPEPAPPPTPVAVPRPAVHVPPVALTLPPDSGLEMVETRFKAAPVPEPEPAPSAGPRRVRPPRAVVAEEPLQIVETRKSEQPPADA